MFKNPLDLGAREPIPLSWTASTRVTFSRSGFVVEASVCKIVRALSSIVPWSVNFEAFPHQVDQDLAQAKFIQLDAS
jgi:hypothetical protein